jgi:acyl carrier protein
MGSALAQADLVGELADLVVTAVGLDMAPESIDPDLQLFGEGLGLDSIDMLEIALAITQKYGFQLRSDNPDNEQIFRSLRTLSAHVALNRVR